jgi:hypothetical protein
MLEKEDFQKYIGKRASYMDYTGLIEEIWNIGNPIREATMTLVKIRAEDGSYATLNFEVIKIEEEKKFLGDSK